MATTLSALKVECKVHLKYSLGLSPTDLVDDRIVSYLKRFTDGNAINKAETVAIISDSVTASGTDSHDLSGGSITDAGGNAITFTKLKGLMLINNSTTAGDILELGGNANAVPLFNGADNAIKVGPGGFVAWSDPSAAGVAVTNSSADTLDVSEVGTSNTVSYTLVLWGTDS